MVILLKSEEIEKVLITFEEERDQIYWEILWIICCTVVGVLFIAIFINIYISYRIVKPLSQLTKAAKIINKLEEEKSKLGSAEVIRQRLVIYSRDDQFMQLVSLFKKVLFGNTGSQKVLYSSGNERVNYSVNYIVNREMKFREQFYMIPH